ncbi:DUF533 domain-containing protein [Rhodospirillum centenum]|uniref:Tellurite resistance TerB family protein n=1 Tax=Rhodospirillum centenum (strain ATCC 51521 / SW) TaxID=414684 RepID=B6INT1_RHOCS|nr:DUF533 domain-containing protein [Rhodospirillum centenum]ACI99265.1 conserved hypothetical protein [Rhodospirillum centenum SW]
MDVERLLGMFLDNSLRGRSVGGIARRAAFSREGLTLIAGIGFAAYEHFRGRQQGPQVEPPPPPGGQAVPPPFPGAAPGAGAAPAAPPPVVPLPAVPMPAAPSGPPPLPPGALTPPAPVPDVDLLIYAAVQAAKADGVLDEEEKRDILDAMEEEGAENDVLARFNELLAGPCDMDGLVARVKDPATAAEVWAASRLAIEPDTRVEQDYLAELARRLGLDEAAVAEIEARLAEAGAGSDD